jgi:hypothetical protein
MSTDSNRDGCILVSRLIGFNTGSQSPNPLFNQPRHARPQKACLHRAKEKSRTVFDVCGLDCGARGRNRTGTPCGGGF